MDDKEKLETINYEAQLARRSLEELQSAYEKLPPELQAVLTGSPLPGAGGPKTTDDPRQAVLPNREGKPL